MPRKKEFGETWWGKRWISVLESFGWDTRLSRGRTYARTGHVVEIRLEPGRVTAKVQGTRPRPYRVVIEIKPLNGRDWDKVAGAMAGRAVFAARLLAGEMPQEIEEAFSEVRLSLFPKAAREIKTSCSCPDWANPCKHVAAVYYVLGQKFDADPFLLFLLRGRTREQLIEALREKRSSLAQKEPVTEALPETKTTGPPLDKELDHFWDAGEELDGLIFDPEIPAVDAVLLKRLGPPPFWREKEDPAALLAGCYRAVSRRTLEEWGN
ncbi:SWIM zinc finger family protein [Desulfotomaculum copahuensis]|uniref:SWIM zinc finger family protein n=1 Tax=Desulfotomaculum copahuensis TaxID=1838280 RepID=UPI00098FBA72|nr:SWIM zinc finger family protein [Desulfotomaculum copahuensis]